MLATRQGAHRGVGADCSQECRQLNDELENVVEKRKAVLKSFHEEDNASVEKRKADLLVLAEIVEEKRPNKRM